MPLALTDTVPEFTLPDTDGQPVPLIDADAPATVVVFTCNHCPYALAWHERINALVRDYADRGVRVLQVNPNDAERHPRDSLDAMRARVARGEFAGPYLHDESQAVARAFGAQTTRTFRRRAGWAGGLSRRARRRPRRSLPGAAWVREALEDVLAGRPVARAETQPVGCSVKWRP